MITVFLSKRKIGDLTMLMQIINSNQKTIAVGTELTDVSCFFGRPTSDLDKHNLLQCLRRTLDLDQAQKSLQK